MSERNGSGVSLRQNALDPGFMAFPTGPADTAGMYQLSRQGVRSAAAPPADPGPSSAGNLRHTPRNQ